MKFGSMKVHSTLTAKIYALDCFRDEVMYFLDPAYPYRLTQLADAMGVDYKEVN